MILLKQAMGKWAEFSRHIGLLKTLLVFLEE
jgi:hypothetical protein